jgi:crotonobetainyl-CoA:carnitine CoA-transferase CaiB-like acyl-CoA transferase
MAMTELARAGLTGKSWSRKRLADGNGATVCILPARDGYVAISPRESHQWESWLKVMGSPDWGRDARFVHKHDRVANWDALHVLMSEWSVHHDKQWIADTAQHAHVPSFPLREPAELLVSPQLAHRRFYRSLEVDGRKVTAPGPPFGLTLSSAGVTDVGVKGDARQGPRTHSHVMAREGPPSTPISGAQRQVADRRPEPATGRLTRWLAMTLGKAGALPLSGVRVLDFSWVIAGPTTTRYLAAMGAEVIKVEAPGRGDPGRSSELHTVLGQAKRGIVLDLKRPEAVAVARALAAKSDVLIENFATGVMDRLGLGAEALQAGNPDLVFVSASGLANRAGGARRRLRHVAAMLWRICRAEPPSGCAASRWVCVAGSDVRADAGVHYGRGAVATAAWRCRYACRFLDDRGDAVDHGRAAIDDATNRAPEATRQWVQPLCATRCLSLRRRRCVDQRRGHDR